MCGRSRNGSTQVWERSYQLRRGSSSEAARYSGYRLSYLPKRNRDYGASPISPQLTPTTALKSSGLTIPGFIRPVLCKTCALQDLAYKTSLGSRCSWARDG